MVCFKEQEETKSGSLVEECETLFLKAENINNFNPNSAMEKLLKNLSILELRLSYILLKKRIKSYLFEEYDYIFRRIHPKYLHLSSDYFLSQYPIKEKELLLKQAYTGLTSELAQFI